MQQTRYGDGVLGGATDRASRLLEDPAFFDLEFATVAAWGRRPVRPTWGSVNAPARGGSAAWSDSTYVTYGGDLRPSPGASSAQWVPRSGRIRSSRNRVRCSWQAPPKGE